MTTEIRQLLEARGSYVLIQTPPDMKRTTDYRAAVGQVADVGQPPDMRNVVAMTIDRVGAKLDIPVFVATLTMVPPFYVYNRPGMVGTTKARNSWQPFKIAPEGAQYPLDAGESVTLLGKAVDFHHLNRLRIPATVETIRDSGIVNGKYEPRIIYEGAKS